MTTFLLVRHATCDAVGKTLSGRAPGVSLNAQGRDQAARLATWLSALTLDAVYASPLERAQQTAAYLAEPRALPVVSHASFTELDFGSWSGRAIDTLAADAHWRRFNSFRSATRPPGGELMLEAQTRAVAALHALASRHAEETVVIVSHADVLRAVAAYFVGSPLDAFLRFEIAPASVTTLALDDWGAQLRALNATPDPPAR